MTTGVVSLTILQQDTIVLSMNPTATVDMAITAPIQTVAMVELDATVVTIEVPGIAGPQGEGVGFRITARAQAPGTVAGDIPPAEGDFWLNLSA